jgi:hypothetical protein
MDYPRRRNRTMNIVAILMSPVIAVVVTLWYQARKERRDAKRSLFFTLMAHRKSIPPNYDLVNGLNLIDIVFGDQPRVLQLWHEYFALLHTQPPNTQLWELKLVDMLSEMASVLGYRRLKQTDIEKFYTPLAHGNQALLNEELQQEFLRVLKQTDSLVVKKKEI